MDDLKTGKVPVNGKGDVDLIFASRPEYEDRKKFTERLRVARSKTMEMNARSAFDDAAIASDHLVFPRKDTNFLNKPRWEGSKAQGLLRIDVAAKLHLNMKPKELYAARCEYREFDLSIFRGHIYQEERRQKYICDKYNYR